jgi:hypothetical protein
MGPRGQPWWAQVWSEVGEGRSDRVKGFFTPWPQNGKTGEDRPRRFTRRRKEMSQVSIFLPLIIVSLVVKVKIVWKPIIRKKR